MSSPELPDRFLDVVSHETGRGELAGASYPIAPHGAAFASQGTAGASFTVHPPRRIALWQLTGPLERRLVDGEREGVLSAPAAPVWGFDPTAPGGPDYAYAGDVARSARVYHVHAIPGDMRSTVGLLRSGEPGSLGVPTLATGDWVHAQWSPQAGRWEILAPSQDLWRFELIESLWPTDDRDRPSAALARLVVYDVATEQFMATSVVFRVVDFHNMHTADAGARGYAQRFADSCLDAGWEILSLESTPATGPSSSSSDASEPSEEPSSSDPSSIESSGDAGEATEGWCSCLGQSAGPLSIRFNNVHDATCHTCYMWEDVYALEYHSDCAFSRGCFDNPALHDCVHLPCDGRLTDTSILLSYTEQGPNTLLVTVDIFERTLLRVRFSTTIDPRVDDPFSLTGIPCTSGSVFRCDWSSATCDILS